MNKLFLTEDYMVKYHQRRVRELKSELNEVRT